MRSVSLPIRRTLLCLLASLPVIVAARPASVPEPEMARYRLGLLWRGPQWTPERTPRTDSIQVAHLANIGRMAEEGVLVGAGPFSGRGDLRGLFFFRADTTFDLASLVERDPAISSGRLRLELLTLNAPRGIGDGYHRRKAQGHADSMIAVTWVFLHRGPKWTSNVTPSVEKVLRRHREYTERLRREGELPFAGGIEGFGDLRGVFVFAGDSATARGLLDRDPAIEAGRFRAEIHSWWNAAGTLPGL